MRFCLDTKKDHKQYMACSQILKTKSDRSQNKRYKNIEKFVNRIRVSRKYQVPTINKT